MILIDEKETKKIVKKGANWLDKNYPGWAVKVDLEFLNMNNCNFCVIGQILGDYNDLPQLAAKDNEWAYNRGFNLDLDDWDYEEENFAVLDALWTKEVRKRVS